jgi:phosphoribosylformylglycinamidine synthase
MKFGVVVFPGSNCDRDAYDTVSSFPGCSAAYIWHKESSLGDADIIVLPGGFSYGDYLRCGAIARFSPVMKEVVRFAKRGHPVIGICNGFQILTEAGLLPGVLLRNSSLFYVCKPVHLKVENNTTPFTSRCSIDDNLTIPIAHGDGNFFCSDDTLKQLQEDRSIVFRYCDSEGNCGQETNPNGSIMNIAGIINKQGNVLGMMPHPERASDPVLGLTDGQKIFESIICSLS